MKDIPDHLRHATDPRFQQARPNPPQPIVPEDDTPRPRRGPPAENATVAVDAVTHPHRSGDTAKLAEPAAPVAGPREPTCRIDPPTRPLTVAELPVPAAADPFDRMAMAIDDLMRVAESLEVERKPALAQLVNGIASAMRQAGTPRMLEFVTCRLATRALLADGGIGSRLDEQEIARVLVDIGSSLLGGMDATRRAARKLSEGLVADAKRYRALAEKQRERARSHVGEEEARTFQLAAAGWDHRADELDAQASKIMRENR